jgi:uncharacterized protein YjbI with pentapeptide repeats
VEEDCIGIRLQENYACLAHADDPARKKVLASLAPGAPLDLRGTPINSELLTALLTPMCRANGVPELGVVRFTRAQFSTPEWYEGVHFTGDADFRGAQFRGVAGFHAARFGGRARFDRAQFYFAQFGLARFSLGAEFAGTRFTSDAHFTSAQFTSAVFDEAQFDKEASFAVARFGNAQFDRTQFKGDADFGRAQFEEVEFVAAQFRKFVSFGGAQFRGELSLFSAAQFTGDAYFDHTQFSGDAEFDRTHFGAAVRFDGAQVAGTAGFTEAKFKRVEVLGPILAAGQLVLDRATFEQPVLIEAVTRELSCVGARFSDTTTFRLRWAAIVLDESIFTKPSALSYAGVLREPEAEFAMERTEPEHRDLFDESAVALPQHDAKPRLLSLRGVDVSNLVLSEIDLSACLFWGAHHLDQLRIEGPNPFSTTPRGWQFGRVGGQGLPVWRWTRRQTVAEEHMWRRSRPLPDAPNGRPHPKRAGWRPPPAETRRWVEARSGQTIQQLEADHLVLLYRRLRKGREDNKNEPGAADFYYGEMEMRRQAVETPWAERVILTLYWLVSGYGLRGLRALLCLVAVIVAMAVLFETVGFAQPPSPATFWGSLLFAARATLSISDQAQLTGWGKLLHIILRLAGPVLLALALLAVRNRVKR